MRAMRAVSTAPAPRVRCQRQSRRACNYPRRCWWMSGCLWDRSSLRSTNGGMRFRRPSKRWHLRPRYGSSAVGVCAMDADPIFAGRFEQADEGAGRQKRKFMLVAYRVSFGVRVNGRNRRILPVPGRAREGLFTVATADISLGEAATARLRFEACFTNTKALPAIGPRA